MTVASSTSRVEYAGNGSTTAFSVPFYFLANGDLKVYKTGVLQTLTTHYSVAGAGNPAGGTVTFVSPPGVGDTVVIFRDPALTQNTDYAPNDPFPAETHERALDRLTMIAQRNRDLLTRALVLPDGVTGVSAALPTPEANKVISWNSTATALQNRDASDFATALTYADRRVQVFTGNGVTTDFVLSETPAVVANTDVDLGGIAQTPGVDYSLLADGVTLRFDVAPANGVSICVKYGQAVEQSRDDANTVYYAPAGTGAVSRSVQSKLRDIVNLRDYGGVINGTADDSAALTRSITAAAGGRVNVPVGTARVSNVQTEGCSIFGDGVLSILRAFGSGTVLSLGQVNSPSQWAYKAVSDLTIDGNSKASDGLTLQSNSVSDELAGRWAVERVTVKSCAKGIHKPYGNIGNAFRDSAVTTCDFGYYAVGQAAPLMHAGCDVIDHVQFDSCALAAIYIDSPQDGTGGTTITGDTILEYNPGFGIFVKNYAASYVPLLMDGVWFEGNATSPSVTINGVSYTPRDLYLENCAQAVMKNGNVKKIQLVNSRLEIENCAMDDTATYTIDSTSVVMVEKAQFDGGLHPVVVGSVTASRRQAGNFAARFLAPPRDVFSHDTAGILQSLTYASANTYSFTGTGPVSATTQADGVIFDSCAELTVPINYTLLAPGVTITNGKWYVTTIDIKHVSGLLSELTINFSAGTSLINNVRDLLATGKWRNIASISRAAATGTVQLRIINGATGTQVLRFSALQIIEFDTEQEALNFYNGRIYKLPNTMPRVTYSTVAPTTGTWAQGDRVFNTAATVGQPKSWVCTVAGSPGTWVSEGNL